MSASRRRSMRWPCRMPDSAHAMASPMSTAAGRTTATAATGTRLWSGRVTARAAAATNGACSRAMPRGWVSPTQAKTTNQAVG